MPKQIDVFFGGEGDRWHERNKSKFPINDDLVLKAIEYCKIIPTMVLEVGCSDGWRLEEIRKSFKLSGCAGIDPAYKTIEEGSRKYPHVALFHGDAAHSRFGVAGHFDLIILGFCLYLCDRDDLFKIVEQTDHNLRDGGHLIIYDFFPEYHHAVPYKHFNGILSYKMDYSKLFTCNPAYRMIHAQLKETDKTAAIILKKDILHAWLVEEK